MRNCVIAGTGTRWVDKASKGAFVETGQIKNAYSLVCHDELNNGKAVENRDDYEIPKRQRFLKEGYTSNLADRLCAS